MNYRFYFDNILVNEPIGWDKLSTVISKNKSKGIISSQESKLTFIGAAHDYLLMKRETEGFCSEVLLRIEQAVDTDYILYENGIIYIAGTDWDEKRRYASTKVHDNSFDSRISNNEDVGVLLFTEKTKNNKSMLPAPVGDLTWYDPATGSAVSSTAYCYRVFDVFKTIISFISDSEVDFASTLFDDGGEFEGLVVTYGKALRKSDTLNLANFQATLPKFSFKDSFDSCFKQFNLAFIIETTGIKPVIRIERESYFRENNVLITFTDVDELKTRIDTTLLYSKISFGSAETNNAPSLSFPEDSTFSGFKQEELPVLGQCNLNSVLDLKNKWVTSSNVIEFCLGNPSNTQYDNNVIFVDADLTGTNTYDAKMSNWVDPVLSAVFYNERLANFNVALRFLGSVPNAIAQFVTDQTGLFQATYTLNENLTLEQSVNPLFVRDPTRYNDDYNFPNSDSGNNYGNGTAQGTTVSRVNSLYTISAGGVYSFSANQNVSVIDIQEANTKIKIQSYLIGSAFVLGETISQASTGVSGILIYDDGTYLYVQKTTPSALWDQGSAIVGGTSATQASFNSDIIIFPSTVKGRFEIAIKRYNASNAFLSEVLTTVFITGTGLYVPLVSRTDTANTGDYYIVRTKGMIEHEWIKINLNFYGGVFKCTHAQTGQSTAVFQDFDPAECPIYLHDFTHEISDVNFRRIKANPKGLIAFSRAGEPLRYGWINQFKMDHHNKKAAIILNAKKQ